MKNGMMVLLCAVAMLATFSLVQANMYDILMPNYNAPTGSACPQGCADWYVTFSRCASCIVHKKRLWIQLTNLT